MNGRRERLFALERCAIVVLGLYVAGRGMYADYLRTEVAAPVAIVIGVVSIVAASCRQQFR